MTDRISTTSSVFATLLLAVALTVGGCASGNIAGPQPDQPDETITQSDAGSMGGATTNGGDGTTGQAGHNVSMED